MSRQLVFLNPSDALVIEAVADFIFPHIKNAQPCNNAYFSRNQAQPKGPADVDETFGYPWWILWPQFQSKILEFAQQRKCVVVTDVATYYDTIDFGRLRNFLSSLGHFSEVLLDFLFFMFERFVWRPDYLPFPGRGLPQINLDAPRLVAHAFLFEVDSLLQKYTNGDFVRWLDDIDFGCDSEQEAKKILRAVDEILLSRGLHLNSSKTTILSPIEAFEHFQLKENRYLTILGKRVKRHIAQKLTLWPETKLLRKRFGAFYRRKKVGQWKKVFKRFINIATDCKTEFMVSICGQILKNEADLRESVYRYYTALDWSTERENHLLRHIETSLDDDSFSRTIDVFLTWRQFPTISFIQKMRSLAFKIQTEEPVRFYGALRLLAKFGNSHDLHKFVTKYHMHWRSNEWLGRQVASIWPRLKMDETRQTVANIVASFGLREASAVIDNFNSISIEKSTHRDQIRKYVLAPQKNGVFPLHKFLITLGVLQTTTGEIKEQLRQDLLSVHTDNIYRFHILKSLVSQR